MTLIEVTVALSILAVAFVALFSSLLSSSSLAKSSSEDAEGLLILSNKIEQIKSVPMTTVWSTYRAAPYWNASGDLDVPVYTANSPQEDYKGLQAITNEVNTRLKNAYYVIHFMSETELRTGITAGTTSVAAQGGPAFPLGDGACATGISQLANPALPELLDIGIDITGAVAARAANASTVPNANYQYFPIVVTVFWKAEGTPVGASSTQNMKKVQALTCVYPFPQRG